MSDTTASIKAKGCESTGITEDVAEKLYKGLGSHLIAIVELEAHARTEDADGNQRVLLRIKTIEPCLDDAATEDVLRQIQRALHGARRDRTEGPMLPIDGASDREPTVQEVVEANPGVIPHDYFPTTTGECDACGRPQLDSIHPHEQEQLDPGDNDPEPPADDEPEPEPGPEQPAEPEDTGTVDVAYAYRSKTQLLDEIELRNDGRPDNGYPVIVPSSALKAAAIAALEDDDCRIAGNTVVDFRPPNTAR